MKAKINQAKNSHSNLSIKSKNRVGMPSQSNTVVQAQLETTTPGDAYEQEADRMADMVMRKIDGVNQSDAMPSSHCPTPTISCFGGTSMPISSEMESQLQAMQGGGHAMPEGLRAQMEGSFGHDFSNVRLHTDSAAADMSSSINAKAFTHGNDIYFNQGQFQPNTPAGQHLIAHELTHTVQQGGKVAREDNKDDIRPIEDVITDIDSIADAGTHRAELIKKAGGKATILNDIAPMVSFIDFFLTPLAMYNNIKDLEKHGNENDYYGQFLDGSNFIGNLTSWSLWPAAVKIGNAIKNRIGSEAAETAGKVLLEKTTEKAIGKAGTKVASTFVEKVALRLGSKGLLGFLGTGACVAAPYIATIGTGWTLGTSAGDIINKAGYEDWQNHKMNELSKVYGDSWGGYPVALISSIPLAGDVVYGIHSIFSDLVQRHRQQEKANNYKEKNEIAYEFVTSMMMALNEKKSNLEYSISDIDFAEKNTKLIIADYKNSGESNFIYKLNTIKVLTGWINSKPTYHTPELSKSQIRLIKDAISKCDNNNIDTELSIILNEMKKPHEDIENVLSMSYVIIEDYVMSGADSFKNKLNKFNMITIWYNGNPVHTIIVSDSCKKIIKSAMKKINLI